MKQTKTEYLKEWRKNNKDKLSIISKRAGLKARKKIRHEIIMVLGGCCVMCNFSDMRALQIDHINGGGTKEIRSFSNRMKYYRHVLKNTHKYQLLCANCNWIKRHENKEI
jgi:hypothetical protein